MKKRLLSTLLALCMVLALLPGTAWAADSPSPADLETAQELRILQFCDPDSLKGPLTRMQVAELIAGLSFFYGEITPVEPEDSQWTDCDHLTSMQRGIIDALRNADIMRGYGDGTFEPEATITRAEVAAILMYAIQNRLGGPETVDLTGIQPYSDVHEESWYYSYVMYLAATGVAPTGGNFNPNDGMAAGDILPWLIRARGRFGLPNFFADPEFLSASSMELSSGGSQEFFNVMFYAENFGPGAANSENWDIHMEGTGLTLAKCVWHDRSIGAYVTTGDSVSFLFEGQAAAGSKLVISGNPDVFDWSSDVPFGPREISIPKHSATPLDVQLVKENGIPTAVTWRVELNDSVCVPDKFYVVSDSYEDVYNVAFSGTVENAEQPGVLAIDGPVSTANGSLSYNYTYTLDGSFESNDIPEGTYSLAVHSSTTDQSDDVYPGTGIGGKWEYQKTPSTTVSGTLDSLINNAAASDEEIKSSLEGLADGELASAAAASPSIFDKIDTLEKRINGSAEVVVAPELNLPGTPGVVGAKLNFNYSANVSLEVDQPENSSIQVPNQDTAETFRFSMKLIEGANNNIAELDVPIRITMPIPAQRLKPQTFQLWHFHGGKLVPVTLTRTPYQVGGQWYVSFVLSGFSDFIMTYEEGTPVIPAATHTITFDTGDAPFTVPAQATGSDGRLSSLPTPTWGSRRFEGWYLSDGTRVTTATVFTGDTTVTARWSHAASAPETNFVSLPKAEHGKVITADRFAAEGERVNLSVHPDKGYALASITVTAAGGKELTLREKSENKFSFTMPDRQVKVVVEFEKIQKD